MVASLDTVVPCTTVCGRMDEVDVEVIVIILLKVSRNDLVRAFKFLGVKGECTHESVDDCLFTLV